MTQEFTATRTMLANNMATAGAELLAYMKTAGALAAIPDTDPQQYVVAGTLEIIGKLLPAVEQSEQAAYGQWISVDDVRKPEPGATVLLHVRTLKYGVDDNLRSFHTEGAQVEMGEYRQGESSQMSYFDCYASPISDNDWVTHWMPLPEGPAASNENSQRGSEA